MQKVCPNPRLGPKVNRTTYLGRDKPPKATSGAKEAGGRNQEGDQL